MTHIIEIADDKVISAICVFAMLGSDSNLRMKLNSFFIFFLVSAKIYKRREKRLKDEILIKWYH